MLGLPADCAAAVTGLWQSADSVNALSPRMSWAHNFAGPGGPAWVWLRPGSGENSAALWWGAPMRRQVGLGGSPGGVLVQYPVSVPNPALEVAFALPGWADFGAGSVPPDVAKGLGIRLVAAQARVSSRFRRRRSS